MRHVNVISTETDCKATHTIFQPDDWRLVPQPAHWTCPFCGGPVWTIKPVSELHCGMLHSTEVVKCDRCKREWNGYEFADDWQNKKP